MNRLLVWDPGRKELEGWGVRPAGRPGDSCWLEGSGLCPLHRVSGGGGKGSEQRQRASWGQLGLGQSRDGVDSEGSLRSGRHSLPWAPPDLSGHRFIKGGGGDSEMSSAPSFPGVSDPTRWHGNVAPMAT